MNGRISDGGVYRVSDLSKAVENNTLNFPEDKPLPFREKPIPHVIVADAAFGLSSNILKPYPFKGMTREERIFNYRLSRARRIVENTFGILANRFRVLLNVIPLKPSKGVNPEEDIDRRFRFVYGKQKGNRPKNEALRIREEIKEYVNGCGSVPWQDSMI
ncbi:hypothetical protein NQ314_014972 [Rhamnusium bicolor]|uniref:DDE Tnp4 domain-containing protein n=1 Tax=Rhamnusium bicolor TaxID=1586634 RepID=A0AAV8X0L9_9CUCU|nr:hypothetical protein NQ314_014972 [Rhamnusium bicolor]